MRFGIAVCLALFAALSYAGDVSGDYPLKIRILRTERRVVQLAHRQVDTTCDTDHYGHTDCTSSASGPSQAVHFIQIAEGPSGETYELECEFGAGRRFLLGAGNATAPIARYGCENVPAETFQAKITGSRVKLAYLDKKGKQRQQAFSVVSMKEAEQRPEIQSESFGTVLVICADESAEVLVDGKLVGGVPAKLKLRAGDHEIKVTKPGSVPWVRNLSVLPGAEVTVNAALQHQ